MATNLKKEKALNKIAEEIKACKICKKDKIGVAVPGEGSADADIVFLGEAPGKKEAVSGRPFIGPAGKVLRGLIKDVGLKDENVYITSPVKYLPKYVTPTPEDVTHGRIHLFKQLDVIQPKIIVLMGRIAALAMLEKDVSVAKEHGTIVEKDGRKYLIAYHPAAQLYSPKVKEELIKDFKKLRSLIRR
jgi:uracil-DNA glycosylase family 4